MLSQLLKPEITALINERNLSTLKEILSDWSPADIAELMSELPENVSYGKEAFCNFGNVELMHGRQITRESLFNAEALIVRSITTVNEVLLRGTPVKFVGTATIGSDHIDLEYLSKNDITYTNAKGCNADAVAEYVFTAITNTAVKNGISIEGKTIGIIGIGNIGSRIVHLAEAAGLSVLKNDPPLQRAGAGNDFVSLNEILKADIITVHVPLNVTGEDKTVHLFNMDNLSQLKEGTIFINASRGQVVDNNALLEQIQKLNLHTVLDVWEEEPNINPDLLCKVEISTPHIAGYSLEGKINGTKIIYDALCRFCNVIPRWRPEMPEVKNSTIEFEPNGNFTKDLCKIFNSVYHIDRDDKELRKVSWMPEDQRGQYFDLLRKNYPLRREFNNYSVKLKNENQKLRDILASFRFSI